MRPWLPDIPDPGTSAKREARYMGEWDERIETANESREKDEREIMDKVAEQTEALERRTTTDALAPLSATAVVKHAMLIQQIMKALMKDGTHYGTIPGTPKPTLYQPGAQKLAVAFRFVPTYAVEREDLPGGHRGYEVTCSLAMPDGVLVSTGLGNCSTMESIFRFRNAGRVCPVCHQESIIKGKQQYGGGWLCYAKTGGCGAKFLDGDEAIEGQHPSRIEHDNPADYWNTASKRAAKRAYVMAVINGTAASDIFMQDIEDLAANGVSVGDDMAGAVDVSSRAPGPAEDAVPVPTHAVLMAMLGLNEDMVLAYFRAYAPKSPWRITNSLEDMGERERRLIAETPEKFADQIKLWDEKAKKTS